MSRNQRVFGFGAAEAFTVALETTNQWRHAAGSNERGLQALLTSSMLRVCVCGGGGFLRSDWLWLIMSCH